MDKKYKALIATVFVSFPQTLFAAAKKPPLLSTYDGNNLPDFLVSIRSWFLGFAGALAILFIVIGGVKYMTAGGNEKQVASAKTTLTYAIIGLLLVLMSAVILNLIAGNVASIFGNSSMPY